MARPRATPSCSSNAVTRLFAVIIVNAPRDNFLARLQSIALRASKPLAVPPESESYSLIELANMSGLDRGEVLEALASALDLPFCSSLSSYATSAEFVSKVPISFARRHTLLGLVDPEGGPVLALGAAESWHQVELLSRWVNRRYRVVLAPPSIVTAAVNEAYQQRGGQAQAMIESLDGRDVLAQLQRQLESAKEDLLDVAGRAPVIKLVSLMLFEAVKAGASDLHVQPYPTKLMVRLRIDGVLYNAFDLPKGVQEEVISRIKVMGRMNIAEKRLAQDGRATVQVGDKQVDLRIASLPTSHGERVVVRLLDKSARLYRLDELGMPGHVYASFRKLVGLEHGLVLVTGPTGSGKSTTLYAALKEIDHEQVNVLTLEDPIEYQLDGISQTQVSEKKGMTFAAALRNVLRQDPDVIMVGEIRDRETATMAIQSALTGHLVFSTLHTNDSASAVTRLLDLGVEPYLVASSVVGVLAQRLVRRVCPKCGAARPASLADRHWLGLNGEPPLLHLRSGPGCEHCRSTGYRGRMGIFELLVVDDPVRRLVQSLATASQIREAWLASGAKAMRDDGAGKVMAGTTTIEEVERVTARVVSDGDPPLPEPGDEPAVGTAQVVEVVGADV